MAIDQKKLANELMGITETDILLKKIQSENHKVVPIGDEIIIPNLSGDLSHGGVLATPTQELNPVNKEYVDSLVRGNVELFLTEDASDIGTYFDLTIDETGNAEENTTQAITGNSTNLIAAYASILDETEIDAITALESGIYTTHIHASANFPVGMKIYFEFYKRTAGGTETLLGTSHDSDTLSATESQEELHASITEDLSWTAGDRIVVKIYGRNDNAATKNITIFVEGDTLSRVAFPAFIPPTFVGPHTIASHSDTTATGAELETLTDNSMADSLHRHSELSASDGTPDQALTVDANGRVNISYDLIVDSNLLFVDVAPGFVGIGTATPGEMLDVVGNAEINGNIIVTGTVDGINIATDVAANTLKDTNVTTNITVVEAPTNVDIQSSDGTNDTIAAADVTNAGVMTTTMYDEHVVNTAHAIDNTQAHTDYLLNSAADVGVGLSLTGDNASADTTYVPNILYNTDATPPTASTVPIGTVYIQYTA